MRTINILLAEDHAIVREGLRSLLARETDFKVIGEAENGREAVALAGKFQPDIVVMDIAMPQLNGMEATRQILQKVPTTKILILSAHSDDAYVDKVMALGAAGYILKQSASHVLPMAIREVHQGKPFFSPDVAQRRLHHQQKARAAGDPAPKPGANALTSREVEVLQLIAEGNANKQTADELNISIKTVEKHRQKVMEKLNIHDTAGLTRYAISAGIIENSTQKTTL